MFQTVIRNITMKCRLFFRVTSPSRKRATITFTADEESYVSAVVTTCPAGDVMTGDICCEWAKFIRSLCAFANLMLVSRLLLDYFLLFVASVKETEVPPPW